MHGLYGAHFETRENCEGLKASLQDGFPDTSDWIVDWTDRLLIAGRLSYFPVCEIYR
jgi:hypothetical protein